MSPIESSKFFVVRPDARPTTRRRSPSSATRRGARRIALRKRNRSRVDLAEFVGRPEGQAGLGAAGGRNAGGQVASLDLPVRAVLRGRRIVSGGRSPPLGSVRRLLGGLGKLVRGHAPRARWLASSPCRDSYAGGVGASVLRTMGGIFVSPGDRQ